MDDLSDDNVYYYTDDYIGHIFDTSLNNSDTNYSKPYIDVQQLYNRIDTFRNKNKNNIIHKNYIYSLKRYVFMICLLAIIFLLMMY
jgi:hypothetical protein